MNTLTRFAGPIAMSAGALWVIATLAQIVMPVSFAWLGLIVAMVLVGGAALGVDRQLDSRTETLRRWGAMAIAAGAVVLTGLLVIALAATGGNMSTSPPTVIFALSLVAFLLWLVGSIVFAISLIRSGAVPVVGPWLIVVGAGAGTVTLLAAGQSPSPLAFIVMAVYGVGWVLVGLAVGTTAAPDLGVAGQPG